MVSALTTGLSYLRLFFFESYLSQSLSLHTLSFNPARILFIRGFSAQPSTILKGQYQLLLSISGLMAKYLNCLLYSIIHFWSCISLLFPIQAILNRFCLYAALDFGNFLLYWPTYQIYLNIIMQIMKCFSNLVLFGHCNYNEAENLQMI